MTAIPGLFGERVIYEFRASHHDARHVFVYDLPAAIARELLKPSADAESLLDSIKKNIFDLGEGFAWVELASGGVFGFLTKFD